MQTGNSTNAFAEVARNKRRATLVVGGCGLSLVVVGAVLGVVFGSVLAGALVGFVLGLVLVLVSYYRSDRIALSLGHARPADIRDYQRYHNLVEGLCIAAGLPKPDLYVIDDPARNAFATGRDPKHATLALTSGLLDDLNRIELEGVIACELSQVKSYDVLVSTATLVPLLVLAPVAALFMQFSVHHDRDFLADASGVQLTRYPPGLCSALKKLEADPASVRHASRATASMWIDSPFAGRTGGSWLGRAFDSHSSLQERIRILEEM
jgi:heat shock protein HtpX